MEKAVLKTLIYADIFNYPLKAYEIHKWLIGKKTDLAKMQKTLDKLIDKKMIGKSKDYYFLNKRKSLVGKRKAKFAQSKTFFLKAKIFCQVFKVIPWIKLVAISGGLAMDNVGKKDDIDLFFIAAKNRTWLSRFFTNVILSPLFLRRSKQAKNYPGKFCLNVFIDEDHLIQKKDVYTAHEILQMKVLWQKEGVYSRFLQENEWVFKFLPNWTISTRFKIYDLRLKKKNLLANNHYPFVDFLEKLTKWLQLKYMGKPMGMERISDGALYFHPLDYRQQVLQDYKLGLKKI